MKRRHYTAVTALWRMRKFKSSQFFPVNVVLTFSVRSFSHLADLVSFSHLAYIYFFIFSGPSFFTLIFSVDFSHLVEFSHLADFSHLAVPHTALR